MAATCSTAGPSWVLFSALHAGRSDRAQASKQPPQGLIVSSTAGTCHKTAGQPKHEVCNAEQGNKGHQWMLSKASNYFWHVPALSD